MRSFFTFLSIILIITLYTVLTSTGDSFTNQINKLINKQNIDIAIQSRYASSPISSKISSDIVEKIKNQEEVLRSEMLLVNRIRIREKSSLFLLGVSDYDVFAQRLGFRLIEGRAINDSNLEIIIGEKMAKVLNVNVGEEFNLSRETFIVVGIYSSWLNFLNAGVVVDLKHAQRITGKMKQASLLFLELKNSKNTPKVIDRLNKMFPDMRAIDSFQFPNFLGPIKSVFYFSRIVSILTLVIAVFVLLNTFIMAISERTKEIGILTAIGWKRKTIIGMFLIESLLLSVFGSLIGYILAFPIMNLLQYKFPSIYMYFPDSPSSSILINVFMMSLLVGILSAVFPAVYGTRLQIAKALAS